MARWEIGISSQSGKKLVEYILLVLVFAVLLTGSVAALVGMLGLDRKSRPHYVIDKKTGACYVVSGSSAMTTPCTPKVMSLISGT